MTTKPNFAHGKPLIDARLVRLGAELRATVDNQKATLANWNSDVERIKRMDTRDKMLRDAMNAALDSKS